MLGRWMAFCAHPMTAWRVLPRNRRLLVAVTYLLGAYVTTLASLLMLTPS